MVCGPCEKKLRRVAAPDPWKAGSRSQGSHDKGATGKLGGSKLLSSRAGGRAAFSRKGCVMCGQQVHQAETQYCNPCAFQLGVCSMCGVQINNDMKVTAATASRRRCC